MSNGGTHLVERHDSIAGDDTGKAFIPAAIALRGASRRKQLSQTVVAEYNMETCEAMTQAVVVLVASRGRH